MNQIQLTQEQVYFYSILSIVLGGLVGFAPLVFGFVRQQRKYALLGFVLTVVGSALFGLLLAIPVSAVFLYLIYRRSTVAPAITGGEPAAATDDETPSS